MTNDQNDEACDTPRRRLLGGALAAGAIGLGSRLGSALAQEAGALPGPLRIIVGSAGAGPDLVARVVADHLRAAHNWNVIVENRVGAGGRIAIEAVRNAAPDGLTLMFQSIELLTLYPHVFAKLNYDPFADFVPVAGVTSSPYSIAVNAKSPHDTLASLVAWLKANPRSASFGTPGAGTPQQFLGAMLAKEAGMEFTHVAYKGGAPAMQDLLGSQIPCIITAFATQVPQARAGNIRILAHSAPSRVRSAPEVPTFAEQGYRSLVAEGDFIMAAPARSPTDLVQRISNAIVARVRTDAFRSDVAKLGQEPLGAGIQEMRERMQRNHAHWGAAVKAANFKPME